MILYRGRIRFLSRDQKLNMDEEEITKLFFTDPDQLFGMIQKNGGDLDGLRKLKLGKLFVKQRFPEFVNQNNEEAVDFVFWFTYFVEREIRDDIFYVETKLGKTPIDIDRKLDDMDFGQKIKFIEDNYISDKEKDTNVQVLREVKKLRNYLAHGELDKLEYGGYYLSDPRGQLKLLVQLHNSALKRPLVK